ncbi:MAG: tripartite tricarboxylate transporter permease, partial [Thermoplasmata archaeon]|nr:tripartite tricarboxylate transporter permease [Thermoplasmata archaeon]
MDPLFLVLGVVLFALLGTTAGVATGVTPGLHVNTVAAIVLAFQAPFLGIASSFFAWAAPTPGDLTLLVASLVVGNVIAHTFLDFIPAIFFGAPEAETALSVLPGHRMLLQGRGLEAVHLSARGSLAAAFVALALIVPFRLIMGSPVEGYEDLRAAIPYLLVLVAAMLIVGEPGSRRAQPRELVCFLPEGVLRDDEEVPELLRLPPSEASGVDEAFLLPGSVRQRFGRTLVVEDERGSVRVRVEGEGPPEVDEKVLLCVTPRPRTSLPARFVPKAWAILVFLLAGLLGFQVLLSPDPLGSWFPVPAVRGDPRTAGFLPLFSGLFALPMLLISLARTPRVPSQNQHPPRPDLPPREQGRAILGGSLVGAFVAWIPGVTAATATVFSHLLLAKEGERRNRDDGFILSLSCVNTDTAFFTIVALFVILRARSGGAAALQTLGGDLLGAWESVALPPSWLAWLLLA